MREIELPSKELLAAITGHELDNIQISGTTLTYHRLNSTTFYLSIYELLHLMKEWAFNKGYLFHTTSGKAATSLDVQYMRCGGNIQTKHFKQSPNEYEAVLQACKWILDDSLNN